MTPRVRVPPRVKAGDLTEIRTLIDHPMETGLRRDPSGRTIPRDMLAHFIVRSGSNVVFSARFANGTAANPLVSFWIAVNETTVLDLMWEHENGSVARSQVTLRVA